LLFFLVGCLWTCQRKPVIEAYILPKAALLLLALAMQLAR